MLNAALAQNPVAAKSVTELEPTPGSQILVDLEVYIPGTGLQILHYGTVDCVVGGVWYEGRVRDPGSLKTMLYGEGSTSGASEIGYGSLNLANPDGGLDVMLNYGIAGRGIVIRKLIAGAAVLMMSCTMEQPVPAMTDMAIRVKDAQRALESPVQATKYAGNNALPNGLEGNADLKDKEKPLVFGSVKNLTPFMVNTSRLIYQASAGVLYSIPNVYDKGVALTAGPDYTSQLEMESFEPDPGTFRAWPGGGYFRLGSMPTGQVTCDAIEGATAADRTAAQVAKRIALRKLSASALDAATFAALDALNGEEVGIYIDKAMTANEALDEVLNSVGAWRGFDSYVRLCVGRLDAPSGSAGLSLTGTEILDLQMMPSNDKGRGVPVYEIDLTYGKNYTVQTSDLAGSIYTPKWKAATVSANSKWRSISNGDGQYIMVGEGTAADYSVDGGVTWHNDRPLPVSKTWDSIAFGRGQFVAVASDGTAYRRAAGDTDWTAVDHPDLYTLNHTICCSGGRFFIFAYASSTDQALTSTDGIDWAAITLPESQQWQSAVYGNGVWVVTTNLSGHGATSTNGTTWTARALPFAGRPHSMIFGNGFFVALDGATTAYTSPDGINYLGRTTPAQNGLPMLTYAAGMYITVSSNGNDYSMYSPNGVEWTTLLFEKAGNRFGLASDGATVVTVAYGNATSISEANYLRIGIDIGRLQFISSESRTVKSVDLSVQTVHPMAEVMQISTLLNSATAAQAEADRQLAMRKVRRDFVAISCKRSALPAQLPALGKVVSVTYPRFGYNTGKLFVLVGVDVHLADDEIILYLWG